MKKFKVIESVLYHEVYIVEADDADSAMEIYADNEPDAKEYVECYHNLTEVEELNK